MVRTHKLPAQMGVLRSYGDPCGIARALDLVGERWAFLIVRELLFGPKRFTDLHGGLAGASPNVLSQRLRELESGGVVRRHQEGAPVYELTDWGRELHPILVQLGSWGARSSRRPIGLLGVDALMVALESTFLPSEAEGLRASYELRLGEQRFAIEVESGTIAVTRGAPRRSHAVIETDPGTLRAVVFGNRKLAGARVQIHGDQPLGRRFFGLFTRPRPGRPGGQTTPIFRSPTRPPLAVRPKTPPAAPAFPAQRRRRAPAPPPRR